MIKIAERQIGQDEDLYIVIEVGTTCGGDLKAAIQLANAAAAAGADAIKFQLIDPNQLSDDSAAYPVKVGEVVTQVNMKQMFEQLQFTPNEWSELSEHCNRLGIHFFATVDAPKGIEILESIGVPAYKVGAWDVTDRSLVEQLRSTGKPILVDLGPTTRDEIDDLLSWAQGGGPVILLHDFHTADPKQYNLRAIELIRDELGMVPGFSSPSIEDDLDFVAVGLGARVIEKRLILSRDDFVFHANQSLEPDELKDWVARIRIADSMLGKPKIIPSDADLSQTELYYRSACTSRAVQAGQIFDPSNLVGKRPGTGISVREMRNIWGKAAARDIPADTLISWSDIA